MDGERIRKYWSNEVKALTATYKHFETLAPSPKNSGAAHPGEDGRFVEELVRVFLRKHLPSNLEVLSGFVLRPAVKTGKHGKERRPEIDEQSSQLDILVYDTANYPVVHRFGDNVIVVPEGVIGIISVKKTLRDGDIAAECNSLSQVAQLCRKIKNNDGKLLRGPFLAVISMSTKIDKKTTGDLKWVFDKISQTAKQDCIESFDELVGYIGVLNNWSVFKARPSPSTKPSEATYIGFDHISGEEHLGLQFLLTGIFSVFYDETRRNIARPGFTAFPSDREGTKKLGTITVKKLR